jgi:hypothetical protein
MPMTTLIAERIDSFISNPNEGTLTGERRMGTGPLLDLVAERILTEDPMINVIRVTEGDRIEYIRSRIDADRKNCILLYGDVDTVSLDEIVDEFQDAQVYRAQEICHQVPLCVRESRSP